MTIVISVIEVLGDSGQGRQQIECREATLAKTRYHIAPVIPEGIVIGSGPHIVVGGHHDHHKIGIPFLCLIACCSKDRPYCLPCLGFGVVKCLSTNFLEFPLPAVRRDQPGGNEAFITLSGFVELRHVKAVELSQMLTQRRRYLRVILPVKGLEIRVRRPGQAQLASIQVEPGKYSE